MPPRILNPALRMRFLCPPTTRPISTTPHLFGGGPRPKKVRNFTRSKGPKIPKSRSVLSATSFTSNPRRHKALKVPKPVFVKPVIRKIMPTGPSRDLIHYIPPSNPLRQKLGPGMYYNTKLDMHRCSSTPLDKDVETEYLYTLMLRRTFSTPLVPIKAVALRYAMNRCMRATGSHKKATATRLRKGFLSEAVGTKMTKRRAWVCDKVRAELFDWDLHENMRFIHGHLFSGKEVDYHTPEGQVYGAQSLDKGNSGKGSKGKLRGILATLRGDTAATATAGAATATAATKIAGTAVADGCGSDCSDSDGKIRDDWVTEDSDTDSDGKLRDDWVREDSGSDTDSETTAQSHDEDEDEDDETGGDEDEDDETGEDEDEDEEDETGEDEDEDEEDETGEDEDEDDEKDGEERGSKEDWD